MDMTTDLMPSRRSARAYAKLKEGDNIKGYYTTQEVHAAAEGSRGYTEVLKRNGRWEHAYPPGDTAEIRILTERDFMFESVPFADIEERYEYVNLAGTSVKVIFASDAQNYPMPRRWGAL